MYSVKPTSELNRIMRLPVRDPLAAGVELVDSLSDVFRLEGHPVSLRPLQALALSECFDLNGVFIALPVGEGKTLITYLLPSLYADDRCVLIIPAKLQEKTKKDFLQCQKNWVYKPYVEIITYETISYRPTIFDTIQPTVIVADESHNLINTRSAVTRRVKRYLKSCQEMNKKIVFVPLSGTITKRSLMDYHHLLQWCLPASLQPLPINWYDAQDWAQALDETPPISFRMDLGALKGAFGETLEEARIGYGKRLSTTPGIITCAEKKLDDLPIEIRLLKINDDDINDVAEHIETYWETPTGIEFNNALDKARHLKECSQGFLYEWLEQPSKDWLRIRSEYNRFVRQTLSHSRSIDTEMQVCNKYENFPEILNWKKIKTTAPKTIPLWFSDTLLYYIKDQLPDLPKPWLVWTEHRAVGERLRELFGWPFYSRRGEDEETGKSIISDESNDVVVCSIATISEGLNLQYRYASNIVLSAPMLGRTWEQMLGRTHRSGQTMEKVCVVIPYTLDIQKTCFEQAVKDAAYIATTTNQQQKLLLAKIK